MCPPMTSQRIGLGLITLCLLASSAQARTAQTKPAAQTVRFVKAFVIDDRLSVLRREPDLQSRLIQRLRLGRTLYIIGSKTSEAHAPSFYRVAVSRRTRGWILESAIAVAGRSGDDGRVMKLADSTDDRIERIALCQLLITRFNRSPLAPRALLAIAEEADRAAPLLSRRAKERLAKFNSQNASLRDYYLSDPALDRYSRMQIRFGFDERTASFVYDGQAYRQIVRRFPSSEEAQLARKQLERARQQSGQQ
jgi:hypothetical protein